MGRVILQPSGTEIPQGSLPGGQSFRVATEIHIHFHQALAQPGSGSPVPIALEDLQGLVEVVLLADALEKYAEYLVEDHIVFVKGSVDRSKGKPNIFADELIALEQAGEKLEAL